MRVLFVSKLVQDRFFTPYALYLLSAQVRKAGHRTEIVDAVSFRNVRAAIRSFSPDIIAFSLVTARWPFFRGMIRALKEEFGLPVIVGGVHGSVRPDIVLEPGIDAVCMGEGDGTLVEYLACLGSGEDPSHVRNLAFKDSESPRGFRINPLRPLIRDFDSLPMPHFELTDRYEYCRTIPVRSMIFSRGCLFRCNHCSNSAYRKLYAQEPKYFRRYSVDRAIEELVYVKERYPCRFFHIFDDLFVADRESALAFAEEYKKRIRLPFYCHMMPGMVEPDTVRALKSAGLHCVGISLETGDERMLKDVLNRHYAVSDFIKSIAILSEAGVHTYVGNILALPGSDLETDLKTLEVNRRAGSGFAPASLFIPLPGTELGDRAREKGYFDTETFERSYHSTDPTLKKQVLLDVPHKNQVRRLQCLFDIATDHDWVARNIKLLIRLPLFYLYLFWFKVHDGLKKKKYLYGSVILPLRLKLRVAFYSLID